MNKKRLASFIQPFTGYTVFAVMGEVMLFALLCSSITSALAQGGKSATDAQYTKGGTESCMYCHVGEQIIVIAETAHGNASNPHAPYAQQGCESCHGPGSLHVSRARGGVGFPALLRFGDRKTRPQQNSTCLVCHGQDMGDIEAMEWTGSLHDTPRMTCVSCHQLHTADDLLTTRDGQIKNCSRCHEDEISNHKRFESKGINFNKLTCYDCHDVHQLIASPDDDDGQQDE